MSTTKYEVHYTVQGVKRWVVVKARYAAEAVEMVQDTIWEKTGSLIKVNQVINS